MDGLPHPTSAAPVRHFDLHYTGAAIDRDGAVPAAVLAQALNGLQRLIHLLAMRFEGQSLNKRARPSANIQKRFPVLCMAPEEGSYVSPTMVGYDDCEWLDAEEAEKISAQLVGIFTAANSGDPSILDKVVPDPTYQRFMFAALADMLPPADSGIDFGVQQLGEDILLASSARSALIKSRDESRPQMVAVVTGLLFDIDFSDQRFGLYHPPTQRKLTCSYESGGESMLLDHPMDLIQVVGVVERDEQGNIARIVRVDEVREIDTSQYAIDGFKSGSRYVKADAPIQVEPTFDIDDQLFLASIKRFGIDAYGETREALESAVLDEFQMLWREFALALDADLAPDAAALKRELLSAFHEPKNAS